VDPVGRLLERLGRILVGEEGLHRFGSVRVDDVDREVPVLPLLRRCRVQAETELLPGRVLDFNLLELRALGRLEELLHDLLRPDRRHFLLGRLGLGVDSVVALGVRAAACGGKCEDQQGNEGDASHHVQEYVPVPTKTVSRSVVRVG
jgi:hypothetical protein